MKKFISGLYYPGIFIDHDATGVTVEQHLQNGDSINVGIDADGHVEVHRITKKNAKGLHRWRLLFDSAKVKT